jgi:hypothetical protein
MAIKIKPSHRGRFTRKAKKAGKSVQGEAHAVLAPGSHASTETKRQAIFAENAAKWRH